GLKIVTAAGPAVGMSAAGVAAVSCVADTYVVVRAAPFQRTTELGTRFVPVTVSVNAGPPATAEDGLSAVAVGTGLLAAVMVNVSALELPPPGAGLNTVTCAVPAAAMSAAGIAAVRSLPAPYARAP